MYQPVEVAGGGPDAVAAPADAVAEGAEPPAAAFAAAEPDQAAVHEAADAAAPHEPLREPEAPAELGRAAPADPLAKPAEGRVPLEESYSDTEEEVAVEKPAIQGNTHM